MEPVAGLFAPSEPDGSCSKCELGAFLLLIVFSWLDWVMGELTLGASQKWRDWYESEREQQAYGNSALQKMVIKVHFFFPDLSRFILIVSSSTSASPEPQWKCMDKRRTAMCALAQPGIKNYKRPFIVYTRQYKAARGSKTYLYRCISGICF